MVTIADLMACSELGINHCIGDQRREIKGVSVLGTPAPFMLVFAGPKTAPSQLQALISELKGAILLCTPALAKAVVLPETNILVCENPRLSFMRAVRIFFMPAAPDFVIHPSAIIHPTARIHPTVSIGPHCVIGENCTIGEKTILYPNVTLYEKVSIGRNVRIHSGTAIGTDGYGYERNEHGELEKFPHIGGVEIGDDVEIGSNTSIDRGTLGNTKILDGVRIDNQVHIAHNVVVGARTAVIAQAMIGGSVKIGEESWIAPAAVVMNQITIGNHAILGLGAVVTKNVADGQTVMGSPAQDQSEFRAMRAVLKNLIQH